MRFVSISKSSSHRDGAHHGGFRVPYTLSTLGWVTKRKVERNFPKNELIIHKVRSNLVLGTLVLSPLTPY